MVRKKTDKHEPTIQTSPLLPIVGIGASAGGLNALKKFFSQVSTKSGLAYVIVVHLAPDHKSIMADLLQPHCKLPVLQVTETVQIKPDHVYIIPPNANLNTIDTHLRLSDLEEKRSERAPVDHFLRTLAQTHNGRAAGVILTGTGSDGTLGMKEIKLKGGLTIAQDPTEAEFDGMPQSAISTGLIDMVLPLVDIPQYLVKFFSTRPKISSLAEDDKEPDKEEQLLIQKIFGQIRARTGRDFTRYKLSTILRRLQRRMQIYQIETLGEYVSLLSKNAEEVRTLSDEFLINVTNFFRDPEVYKYIEEEVIPGIFESKSTNDQIRIWSVGCATGEEAYSLGMLMLEAASTYNMPPNIQIFASDLHERSLSKGRYGFYPGDIKTDVSEERLERFFMKEDGGFRVKKELRELVIFTPHNVLGDPPFSKLDMVVCRNLLIYLKKDIQRDVIELFHYSMLPEATMVLGPSEQLESTDLFSIKNKNLSVFKKRNVNGPEPKLPVFPQPTGIRMPEESTHLLKDRPMSFGAIHHKIVELYGPPSILLSPDFQVLHVSDTAGRYLKIGGGELSRDIFNLIREDLKLELQGVLYAAREGKKMARSKPMHLKIDGEDCNLVITSQVISDSGHENMVLVMFNELEETQQEMIRQEKSTTKPSKQQEAIERELHDTKQRLQSIIEEYETNREEMRASNEEMQSTNEELRSAMEELETSKEELQSLNEELTTVNQENRHKVEELALHSDDLQNLLSATDIATVFLDRELRILRFTPRLGELFNVRPADRGRPISDQTHKLGYTDLVKDAKKVMSKLQPIEREVKDHDGGFYLTRILPYRSSEDKIMGVVISFIEVSNLKTAEENLRASEERLRAFVNASADILYQMNANWTEMYELDGHEVLSGKINGNPYWMDKHVHPDDQPKMKTAIEKAIRSRTDLTVEHRARRSDGSVGWTQTRAVPVFDADGNIMEWFGAHSDVTSRKRTEEELRISKDYAERIIQTLHEPLLVLNADFKVKSANNEFYKLFKVDPDKTVGHKVYDLGNGQWDIPRLRELLEDVLPENNVFNDFEVEHEFESIGKKNMLLNARRLDSVQLILLGIRDITKQKADEQLLRKSEDRLKKMVNIEGVGILIFNEDLTVIDANEALLKMTGYTRTDVEKRRLNWKTFTPPEYEGVFKQQLKKLEASGRIGPYEKEFYLKNKKRTWMMFAGASLNNGVFIEYCIDISDRKRAEIALEQNEERLRLTLDSIGMGSWEMHKNEGVGFIDEGYVKLFELDQKPGNYDFRKFYEHVHPDDDEMLKQEVEKAWNETEEFNAEFRIVKNGVTRWIAGRGRVVNMNGIQCMIGVNYDITNSKQMQEELVLAKQKAEKAARAKEDFLAHMSHEIRTPLNAVIGLSHLLMQKNPKKDQLDNLQTLNIAAENLGRLINDILDFSKVQAGKVVVEKDAVPVHNMVKEICTVHSVTAAQKGIELKWNIESDIPKTIITDQVKLGQVLHNLMSNAVKFTHKGHVKLEIKLQHRDEQQLFILFEVSDTGIGIRKDKLGEIFDVFSQGDSTTVRKYEGTGLGLTLTRIYLNMMDSDIKVESARGKGSRFYFTLPVTLEEAAALKKQKAKKKMKAVDLSTKSLLLVEDTEFNMMIMEQSFEMWEVNYEGATNGEEAVEKAKEHQFDIILMDIRMPLMDGYDATREIRKLSGYRDTPIIALTADVSDRVKEEKEAGLFTDIIIKPVEPKELKEKIIEKLR